MKLWILLLTAVALLVWSLVRERFEATPSIKAPPYDAAEKRRIFDMVHQRSPTPPYTQLGYQDILMNKAKQQLPNETNQDKLKEAAGGFVTPAIESFFTTVFKPATTPITKEQVDTFVDARASDIKMVEKDILTTYFVGQSGVGTSGQGGANSYAAALAALGQNAGYLISNSTTGAAGAAGAASTAGAEGPPPVCPAGTIKREEDGKCVSTTSTASPSCPTGYTLESDKKCHRIGGTETTEPTCPAGFSYNSTAQRCDTTPVDPTCPGGYEFKSGKCVPKTGSAAGAAPSEPSVGSNAAPAGPAAGAASSAGSGASTTGGSSTSTWGPTSGGPTKRLRQIFGPQYTGSGGDLSGSGNGDSSQTNVYPELLGGLIDTSSRIPGAGIVPPSKNWTLPNDGSLPNSGSMGADEMSRYFPFSRTPGDMDIIPDPYRVAQVFSPSSYSSKTEPVPFLTDFSAFQK